MTLRASTVSLEFLRIPISVSDESDPTALPVAVALAAAGEAPTTFVAAAWEAGGPPYYARILVGDGGDLEPAEGTYDVYVRITDTPEEPAFIAERLVVFATSTLLASVSQLADKLGADIDPENAQAHQAVADASAFIRSKTGQTISLVEADEVELVGNWTNVLQLPQLPVIAVEDVTVRYGGSTSFYDVAASGYSVDRRGRLIRSGYWGGEHGIIRLTYDHGYAVVPADIEAVCLSLAARFYRNPSAYASETLGSWSYSHGDAAPAAGLSEFEASVLRNYRLVS